MTGQLLDKYIPPSGPSYEVDLGVESSPHEQALDIWVSCSMIQPCFSLAKPTRSLQEKEVAVDSTPRMAVSPDTDSS